MDTSEDVGNSYHNDDGQEHDGFHYGYDKTDFNIAENSMKLAPADNTRVAGPVDRVQDPPNYKTMNQYRRSASERDSVTKSYRKASTDSARAKNTGHGRSIIDR